MKEQIMKKMQLETKNSTEKKIEELGKLFPSIITEVKDNRGGVKKAVDFEKLKNILGDALTEEKEVYEFTWPGKRQSMLEALRPLRKVLRPSVEESINWDKAEHIFIEGDNLEALKLIRESYLGKVKMIYIDPPYNTGHDFIYPDSYKMGFNDYAVSANYYDENGNINFTRDNSTSNALYHSDWCSMIYPRLLIARDLLTKDGVIYISIDNNEVASMKQICDEVFGQNSFVTIIHVQMSTVQGNKVKAAKAGNLVKNTEYILVYSKDGHKEIGRKPLLDPVGYDNHYNLFLTPISKDTYIENSLIDVLSKESDILEELQALSLTDKKGKLSSTKLKDYYSKSEKVKKFIDTNADFIVRMHDSIEVDSDFKRNMISERVYQYFAGERDYLVTLDKNGRTKQRIRLSEKLNYADDFYRTYGPTTIRGDWWPGFYLDMGNISKEGGVAYNNGKKPVRLLEQLIDFTTNKDDIVLDFFAGSCTTAHAVLDLNRKESARRKFIVVQIDEDLDLSLQKATGELKKEIEGQIDFLDSVQRKHYLSELGKERITRILKQKDFESNGFRCFSVDSSNMKDIYYAPDEYSQYLLSATDSNIKEGRTDLDLLFACLLEWGLDLSRSCKTEKIAGMTVHIYDQDTLIACFADNVPEEVVREIAKRKPLRAVFRDSSFVNDTARVNLGEIFKLLSPDTDVKIL